MVLAYARRRTSEAIADDVAAETFAVAWRRADAIPTDPLPWLIGVARRVLATQRRTDTRQHRLAQRLREVPVEHEVPTVEGRVGDALTRLSETDRDAILLVAWDDLTVTQAAEAIGISAARFSVRLYRARRRLRDHLEQISSAEVARGELPPIPRTSPSKGATR